jgi:hypothetical protein
MDLISESHHLRAWCRRQFCLNKVDFRHLDYIHSVHKLLDNADLNRRLLRVDSNQINIFSINVNNMVEGGAARNVSSQSVRLQRRRPGQEDSGQEEDDN